MSASVSLMTVSMPQDSRNGRCWLGCLMFWRPFGTKSGHSLPPGINKKIIRILWGFIIVGCLPSQQATSNIESSHEKKCRLVTLFFSRGKCIVKCTKASVVCSHWTQCCFYLAQRAGGTKEAWQSMWTTVFPVVGFDHDICVMWGHKQHVHKPQLD